MKIFDLSKIIALALLLALGSPLSYAQIGMRELGDSLMAYTGFSRLWSPSVRVKQLRVSGDNVSVRTNQTLHDFRWTDQNLDSLCRKVSLWTLGHENGKVTIYAGSTDIRTLITDCARGISSSPSKAKDLTERNIVLYPSHGLYFNRDRAEWIWQRATLWTTVEDLYSQEYVRYITRMLENAGANVLSPRAGLDERHPGLSGMPRWTEGARYWLMHQQADSTLWDLYDGNEYKDDMKSRGLWVNSLETDVDLCVALHTDGLDSGDDSTIVGTLVIYTAKDDDGNTVLRDGKDREKANRNLGDWIQTQLTEDLRTLAPEWTRRQLKEANYCESRVPVVPSIILELLSHKNMADMRYGLDPAFRFAACRAVYKGILRYLNGKEAVVQPLPVHEMAIAPDGTIRWTAPIDSLEPSATPTYYMVYVRADEGEWDVQQVEKKTELKLNLQRGVQYDCYVVAGNDGGLSMPGPMVSAYLAPDEKAPMALIVDAFDDVYGPDWFADSTFAGIVPGTYACESDFSCAYIGEQWDYRRASLWTNDDNCGWGACYRDHAGQLTVGNTRDWAMRHGRALRQMKISYVSTTAGLMTEPDERFKMVDYICGRQRQPIGETQKTMLAAYLAKGGRLLLSTDHFSAIDPKWAVQNLHASFYAARATRSGRIVGKRHYQLLLTPNEEQLFTCTPEGLKIAEGAAVMATYRDMRCPAAVGFKGPKNKTLVFGFPLEAVTDFDKIYTSSIQWLNEQ